MRLLVALAILLAPSWAMACGRPVCAVDPAGLALPQTITFDDQSASPGPGRQLADVLALPGASFGERFAGQVLAADGDFDSVDGAASQPLTLLPGAAGRNLSMLWMPNGKVLSGDGPAGFPRQEATGEGAIAMVFDRDQGAVRLWIRGGDGGAGRVLFVARDGALIDSHDLQDLGEAPVAFVHAPGAIAGIVLTNRDPEGIALDQVDFGSADRFSAVSPPSRPGGRGFSPGTGRTISPPCSQISSAA